MVELKQCWDGTSGRLNDVETFETIKRTLKQLRKFSAMSSFQLK
jgi:hypothetical protein